MQQISERHGHRKLKELVVEASQALARLDADRLEELALSCQALNRDLGHRDLAGGDADGRAALAVEAKEAVGEMAVLARVLEATRANLNVMNRLRELRQGGLEYHASRLECGEGRFKSSNPEAPGWPSTEGNHGDN
ncbi:MAG: hypothetical protein ABSE51_04700 [Terracidiphilus sp.]